MRDKSLLYSGVEICSIDPGQTFHTQFSHDDKMCRDTHQ